MKRHVLVALVRTAIAGAILALPSFGQTAIPASAPIPNPLTLSGAIRAAQDRYPAIRAAEEQQEAAKRAIGVAKTAYLPRADILWQGNRATTNKPNIAFLPQGIVPVPDTPARPITGHSDWNTVTGVLLAWEPLDFGKRRAQVDAARFGYTSAQYGTELSRLDVASAAAGAYLDVVASQQAVLAQQANVNRMETFARTVHVLVDNSLRPGADASMAEAQLALARTRLIQAQTQEQVRFEALANLLRVPSPQIAIDGKDVLSDPPNANFGEFPPSAHPAAEQASALYDKQKEQLRVLNRSYAPVFNFYGSVSGLGAGLSSTSSAPAFEGGGTGLAPQTYNWLAALQVTFPAFQIFTIREQKQVQQAEVLASQAIYQQTLGDLSAEEKQAEAMLDGARRVAQNTPVEVAAARDSEAQQQARYKSGLATVIDVAAAEAALAQAEGDDAQARVNVWRGLAGVAEAQGDLAPLVKLLGGQP